MTMRTIYIAGTAAALIACSCSQESHLYAGKEYIMFSDTLSVNPVYQGQESFNVPVASTVARDYDRTFAVEIIDHESTAIEGRDYTLRSNTITIPAGETVAYAEVLPVYDRFKDTDTLSFNLRLVMDESLKWDMYGDRTKVSMYKICPFDINTFSGPCVVTSLFLYSYPGSENKSYQRLIWVDADAENNTVTMRNWLFKGYDVTLRLDTSDPANPIIRMDEQMLSDEESVFGKINGDNRILCDEGSADVSYYSTCQKFIALWTDVYVYNMSSLVGTVGSFYNLMEFVSEEEADRLDTEGVLEKTY